MHADHTCNCDLPVHPSLATSLAPLVSYSKAARLVRFFCMCGIVDLRSEVLELQKLHLQEDPLAP
jgi:hypothetical protein